MESMKLNAPTVDQMMSALVLGGFVDPKNPVDPAHIDGAVIDNLASAYYRFVRGVQQADENWISNNTPLNS